MFEHLKKALAKEYDTERKTAADFIKRGYIARDQSESRPGDRDRGLERYLTPARWDAYKAGWLDRSKAVEIATARAYKEIDKRQQADLDKLTAAEIAPEVTFIDISVEWSKSRTWGANPSVTVRTNDGVFYGHASGCGYDKESAAIAEALNQSPAVKKVLYTLKNKGLHRPPKEGFYHGAGYVSDRRSSVSICGYGAGYGVLPYFEGGVGSSCFWRILEKCGYTCRNTGSGKMFDAYSVAKAGRA